MIDGCWFDLATVDTSVDMSGAFQIHNTDNHFLTSFHGLGLPEPRPNRFDRPRTHGIYDRTTYYGARIFELSGMVVGSTVADALDRLDELKQKMALTGLQKRLWFQRQGRAYVEFCDIVAASGMDADFDLPSRVIPWSISLCAADPRLYEDELDTVSFAAAGNADNQGNFNTPPIIRIYGPGTDGGVENTSLTTENVLQIDQVLAADAIVTINVAERTVHYQDGLIPFTLAPELLDMSVSSFFKLTAGVNALEKVGGADHIEVDWRNARI